MFNSTYAFLIHEFPKILNTKDIVSWISSSKVLVNIYINLIKSQNNLNKRGGIRLNLANQQKLHSHTLQLFHFYLSPLNIRKSNCWKKNNVILCRQIANTEFCLFYSCSGISVSPPKGQPMTPSKNTELFKSNLSGPCTASVPMIGNFGTLFVNERKMKF